MNSDSSPLRHEPKLDEVTRQSHSNARDFSSIEEMLRYDATQTSVPPQVEEKISDSISKEPKPARSWWRRLFSSSE